MIVCSCYGVSDRTILKLLDEGLETPREIERACGAGGDCGSCQRQICQLIDEENAPPLQQTG